MTEILDTVIDEALEALEIGAEDIVERFIKVGNVALGYDDEDS